MKSNGNIHTTAYRVIKAASKYGIEGTRGNQTVTAENLTSDLNKITEFVEILNTEQLELCHLKEVAEDFLYNISETIK